MRMTMTMKIWTLGFWEELQDEAIETKATGKNRRKKMGLSNFWSFFSLFFWAFCLWFAVSNIDAESYTEPPSEPRASRLHGLYLTVERCKRVQFRKNYIFLSYLVMKQYIISCIKIFSWIFVVRKTFLVCWW